VPFADNAEALEFFALHLDPMLGELPALAPEFDQSRGIGKVRLRLAFDPIILFLDFPFDRQAMAVPARHVVGIEAEHLLASRHHILKNFIERMTNVDVAVGVRRTVMKDKARPALRLGAQPRVEAELLPARQNLGLLLRQPGAHRKTRLGEKQRLAVIARFRFGHCRASGLGCAF